MRAVSASGTADVMGQAAATSRPSPLRVFRTIRRNRPSQVAPSDLASLPAVASSRAKRMIDASTAGIALVLTSWILLLVAIAVIIDAGWPAFFSQERVGLQGHRFRMWKFRTMVRGAEELRAELAHLNEAPFPAFKVRNDPRITRVGRFLRMSSLDELPQLWNVVRGEMSLVGPRPALPGEVLHYDETAMRRLAARPGITGAWQIEYRHRGSGEFSDWVQKDLGYVDGWSLARDAELLARTVGAVLRMTGR
jgi:lipopolysaccharide/colanic/teichoic acid biosynthesis glycosyltransferase